MTNTPENQRNKKLSEILMEIQALEQEEAGAHRLVMRIQERKWALLRQAQELLNGKDEETS